jgi:hypothetical protein
VLHDEITKRAIEESKELTLQGSSYIMAALDRVIHHSVILDMMKLESYQARTAQLRLQGEGGELTE